MSPRTIQGSIILTIFQFEMMRDRIASGCIIKATRLLSKLSAEMFTGRT